MHVDIDELYDRIEDLEIEIDFLKGKHIPFIEGLNKIQTALLSMLFARKSIVSSQDLLDNLIEIGYSKADDERASEYISVLISHIRKVVPEGSIKTIWAEGFLLLESGREWYRNEIKKHTIEANSEDFENYVKLRTLMLREPKCDDAFTEEENAYIRYLSHKTTANGASRVWKRTFGRPRTTVTLIDQAKRLGCMFKPPSVQSKEIYDADQEAFLRVCRDKKMSLKEIAYEYNKRYETNLDYVSIRNHFKLMGLGSNYMFRMKTEYLLKAHRCKDQMTSGEFRKWLEEESGCVVSSATVSAMCKRENIEFRRVDGRGTRWSKAKIESE